MFLPAKFRHKKGKERRKKLFHVQISESRSAQPSSILHLFLLESYILICSECQVSVLFKWVWSPASGLKNRKLLVGDYSHGNAPSPAHQLVTARVLSSVLGGMSVWLLQVTMSGSGNKGMSEKFPHSARQVGALQKTYWWLLILCRLSR